jgi:polar amino acid transport system substrate-binding protein
MEKMVLFAAGGPVRVRLPALVLGLLLLAGVAGAQEPFVIGNSYQNLLSNDRGTGMLDRIFLEAFDRIGLDVEIVFTETERSIIDANRGVLAADANRVAGMERAYPNLRRVPEPNMTMEFVAFSKWPIDIDGWESLRDLDIGLVRGWKILEEHTAGFPRVVTVPSENELFTMLSLGRIDVALYARLTGYAALAELGIDGCSHLEPPLATRDMYLYVHKRHEDLIPDIARALRDMKDDGTYATIVDEVRSAAGVPAR